MTTKPLSLSAVGLAGTPVVIAHEILRTKRVSGTGTGITGKFNGTGVTATPLSANLVFSRTVDTRKEAG